MSSFTEQNDESSIRGEVTWDALHEWCEANPGSDPQARGHAARDRGDRRLRQEMEAKLAETRRRMALWDPQLPEGTS